MSLRELRLGELDRFGLPRARHEHPRPRRARLPGVLHAVVDAGRNRLVERRIVQHDERRLAAKLEAHLLDALARQRRHAAAGLQRSGEAHHVDIGMPDDGFADDAARSADDVEDAGGKADLVRRVGEHQRAQRRELRRLEHDRASGRERRRDLRDDLVQRIVPRRHAADDAERLLDDRASCRALLRAWPRGGTSRSARSSMTGNSACTLVAKPRAVPTSCAIASAICGTRAFIAADSFSSHTARSSAGVWLQRRRTPARAALTARSTSSGVPRGTRPIDFFGGRRHDVDRVASSRASARRRRNSDVRSGS